MASSQNYLYEVLISNEDVRACAQLISNSFTKSNAVTMSFGITTEQHIEQVSFPLINKVLNERLSFFARNRTTQEIVGCIITGDLYLSRLYDESHTDVHSLTDLLKELDDMFVNNLIEELKANTILHIELTATKTSEEGKGLATRLSQIACEYARQTQGFSSVYVQVTHPATKHIYLKKLNGKIIAEVDPTTWIWKRGGNIMPYKEWTTGPILNILFSID